MLGVGGRFADIAERSALARAENGVAQINTLMDQARRLHSQIGDLGQMNVAQGSVMGDIIFDNIFSDYAMQQKIKDSEMQLQLASRNLNQQVEASKQREGSLILELNQATASLH